MKRLVLPVVFGAVLSACQPANEKAQELTPTATPTPIATATSTPKRKTVAMPAGKYCYFLKSETSTEGLQLTLDETGVASAQYFGTIHNDAAAYYAAFETQLSNGKLDETGKATFSALTEVDGDTQQSVETWSFTPDSATSGDLDFSLTKSPCATLLEQVWPQIE